MKKLLTGLAVILMIGILTGCGKIGDPLKETEIRVLAAASLDPAARVINVEADEREKEAAADFLAFLSSAEAKAIFERYLFENVK